MTVTLPFDCFGTWKKTTHIFRKAPEPRCRLSSAATIVAGQTESKDSSVNFHQGSSSQATVLSVGPPPSSGSENDSDPEDKALSIPCDSPQHEDSACQMCGTREDERCNAHHAVADAIKNRMEVAAAALQSAIAGAANEPEDRGPPGPETDTRLALLERWREVLDRVVEMNKEENSRQMPDFLEDFVETAKAANESCSTQIDELSRSTSSSPDGLTAS